jgi:hypothetical protein
MKSKSDTNNTAGSDCQERLVLPLPSWFAEKGVPCCSKWGKTEIEYLAWAYAAAQARDGDTWHEITPEKAYELLAENERRVVGGFTREGTLHHAYLDWWAMIGRQLRDADGAFEVGGLSWTRWKFNRENAIVVAPATLEPESKNDVAAG